MVKAVKIDDVKRPERVTPPATARPIIVTNHPTMATDPMMTTESGEKKADAPPEVLSHTAKTIAPLGASLNPSDSDDKGAADTPDASPEAESDDAHEPTRAATITSPHAAGAEATKALAAKADAPKPEVPRADEGEQDSLTRDPDAAQIAQEAAAAEARAKRDVELEEVIASGKYAVPIDAVQRHRSRVNTMVLCTLALLLAVALADAVADAGVVKLPAGIPHSHFFSKS